MRAMQHIQPDVKKLQKEFKGDREELNKHLMALYKERGVNPAAGLPAAHSPAADLVRAVSRSPGSSVNDAGDRPLIRESFRRESSLTRL